MASVEGIEHIADRLALNAALPLPDYYRKVDIHQHPGGLWSDEIAGFVYERGARSTTPLMGKAHKDLHQRFTDFVADLGTTPSHILDMGCGFGKSTRPFYETFKDAIVEAIDLSAPCLKVGAHEAGYCSKSTVRYRQMDALTTDYDDNTFDLVTSTMLIHELPPAEIDQLFAEATRVLAPGGRMVAKLFQGPEAQSFMAETKDCFLRTVLFKPAASRSESREVFVVADGFKLGR